MTTPNAALIPYASQIAAAYVSRNHLPPAEVPALLGTLHGALSRLGQPAAPVIEPVEPPTPAEIRRSITPDALISFIDGRPYKTMKRHLAAHGLTPEGYRARYGLPADYPTVCPSYSAQRSALARTLGLGVPGARAARAPDPAPAAAAA